MSKTSEMIASFHEMKCACGFGTRNRVKGQPASHFLTAHAHSVRVARYRQTGNPSGMPSSLNVINVPRALRECFAYSNAPGAALTIHTLLYFLIACRLSR